MRALIIEDDRTIADFVAREPFGFGRGQGQRPPRSSRQRGLGSGVVVTDSNDRAALGVAVAPLTPELASRAGLPRDARGLVVQEVNPDSRAVEAGVQAGDVIQEVNRQPVQSVDEIRAAVRRTSDRPVLLLVNREGRDLFLTARLS